MGDMVDNFDFLVVVVVVVLWRLMSKLACCVDELMCVPSEKTGCRDSAC